MNRKRLKTLLPIIGLLFIISSFLVTFIPNGYNQLEYKKYGADFYTDEYNATRVAAINTYQTMRTVRLCGGMFLFCTGLLVISVSLCIKKDDDQYISKRAVKSSSAHSNNSQSKIVTTNHTSTPQNTVNNTVTHTTSTVHSTPSASIPSTPKPTVNSIDNERKTEPEHKNTNSALLNDFLNNNK